MTAAGVEEATMRRRSTLAAVGLAILMLIVFVVLIALGTWQVQRRVWKLHLIAEVQARVHAPPISAPGPSAWSGINAEHDVYRRVRVTGAFDNAKEALVMAVTEKGPGFWVVTPLKTPDGFSVLINRGFVPDDRKDAASRLAGQSVGPVTITGLMRMSEPRGGFLRSNAPADNRWYSRDVQAIAAAKGVSNAAPYFIDADSTPNPGGLPVGGLTVIAFPNSHLTYALTWYGMALLLAGAGGYILREEWRGRHSNAKAYSGRP